MKAKFTAIKGRTTGNLAVPAHATLPIRGRPAPGSALLTLMLLAALLAAPLQGADAQPLRINTASVEPFVNDQGDGFLDLLIGEIFQRAGSAGRINRYPRASARSIQMADNGIDDGEALRINGQEGKHPNLVRVPEVILVNNFVGYSTPGKIKIEKFEDLKPYSVGHIIGWWIFQKNLEEVPKVTTVKSADQLFSLLRLQRLDVALYEKWQGLWVARSLGVPVMVHTPSLAQVEMFMYLHKKHTGLVPKVATALAGMKQDGSYARLYDQRLTTLLSQ